MWAILCGGTQHRPPLTHLSYDLTDKLIIPFCTSGGSDIGETMPTFLNSCDGLAVYGERRISGTSQLDGWLSELGLTGNAAQPGNETQVESSEPETVVSEEDNETAEVSAVDGKTLIVYFSWSTSGNTEKMANTIQERTGGDILEIEPSVAYPTDYNECGDVAKVERDENARPEIANLPDSIEEYDTIFVGYPIWWHTAPMIIGTFLENYDFSGAHVYPFTQSASIDGLRGYIECLPGAKEAGVIKSVHTYYVVEGCRKSRAHGRISEEDRITAKHDIYDS